MFIFGVSPHKAERDNNNWQDDEPEYNYNCDTCGSHGTVYDLEDYWDEEEGYNFALYKCPVCGTEDAEVEMEF